MGAMIKNSENNRKKDGIKAGSSPKEALKSRLPIVRLS